MAHDSRMNGVADRNFTSDENDSKNPMAHDSRMNGVADRLMANPRLLEQYNEKYLDKKFETNSVLRRHNTRAKIERSRSQEIQRRASSRMEKEQCPTYNL